MVIILIILVFVTLTVVELLSLDWEVVSLSPAHAGLVKLKTLKQVVIASLLELGI
jgi:hypothetical protein